LFPLDLFLERDEADDGVASTAPVNQTSFVRSEVLVAIIITTITMFGVHNRTQAIEGFLSRTLSNNDQRTVRIKQ
jgi:hypothetical protein